MIDFAYLNKAGAFVPGQVKRFVGGIWKPVTKHPDLLVHPATPSNARVLAYTDTEATIAWDLNTGDATSQYRLRVNGTYYSQVSASKDRFTFTGLTPGVEVRLSVQARASDGRQSGNASVYVTPTAPKAHTEVGVLSALASPDENAGILVEPGVDPSLMRVTSLTTSGSYSITLGNSGDNRPILVTDSKGRQCFRFDGVDERLYNSTSTGVLRERSLSTVSVAFRANADAIGEAPIFYHNGSRFYMTLRDGLPFVGGNRQRTGDVYAEVQAGTADLRDGDWHTLIATYDYMNVTLTVLLDGVVVYDGPWATGPAGSLSVAANGSLYMGYGPGGLYFLGDIYEASVHRTGLTLAEATDLHRTLLAGASLEPMNAAASVVNPEEPAPEPEPEPEPEPVAPAPTDPVNLTNDVRAYIDYARRNYYPDGTGEWAHMPPWWEWQVMYWVPKGSTFQSPNGEYVYRGSRFSGNISGVVSRTTGTGSNGADSTSCAIVICPERFEDGVSVWNECDLWRGVILVGMHMYNSRFLGHSEWNVYKNGSDTFNQVNGITPVRPGHWRYNPWDTGLTSDEATIDHDPVRGRRMHERSLYVRPGSGAPDKAFMALEGTYLEGDWVIEGLNVNGIGADGLARLVIAGYRHDRASVYFRMKSTATTGYVNGGKWPGGDSIQVFGNLNDLMIVGGTAHSHYQALFLQNDVRKKVHVIKWNSKTPQVEANGDPTYYGGQSGFQAWPGGRSPEQGIDWQISEWYAWKNGLGTIDNASDFPEIESADVPDFVNSTDEIGVRYAANPLPFVQPI